MCTAQVELVTVHGVYRLTEDHAPVISRGRVLRATDEMRHGHSRGVAKMGPYCRPPRPGELERWEGRGEVVLDGGIAAIAKRARECAKRMRVPTWECRQGPKSKP